MNIIGLLEPIINKDITEPGDYIGEDGLLHCGKCKAPKQMYGTDILDGRLLPVLCTCQLKARKVEEDLKKQKQIEILRKHCLPAEAMRKHTFDLASDEKHIQIARRYVENFDKMRSGNYGLLLWGNSGTGKSFTAHCIANALIDKEIYVCLYSAVELVSRLMDRDLREETIRTVWKAPVLIIDDMGAERDSPYAREQLGAMIENRAESEKPLIVTTNYTLAEMTSCKDKTMQRIFDRLEAMCVPVGVIGESRRREIGFQKKRDFRELLDM